MAATNFGTGGFYHRTGLFYRYFLFIIINHVNDDGEHVLILVTVLQFEIFSID